MLTSTSSHIVKLVSDRLPALFQATPDGGRRFWEFFTVNIRNRTRGARTLRPSNLLLPGAPSAAYTIWRP